MSDLTTWTALLPVEVHRAASCDELVDVDRVGGGTEEIDHHSCLHDRGSFTQRKTDHCSQMILELRGAGGLDREVARVVRSGGDLVHHQAGPGEQELHRHDADDTEFLGDEARESHRLLFDRGIESGRHFHPMTDPLYLDRAQRRIQPRLTVPTADQHHGMLGSDVDELLHHEPLLVTAGGKCRPFVDDMDTASVITTAGVLRHRTSTECVHGVMKLCGPDRSNGLRRRNSQSFEEFGLPPFVDGDSEGVRRGMDPSSTRTQLFDQSRIDLLVIEGEGITTGGERREHTGVIRVPHHNIRHRTDHGIGVAGRQYPHVDVESKGCLEHHQGQLAAAHDPHHQPGTSLALTAVHSVEATTRNPWMNFVSGVVLQLITSLRSRGGAMDADVLKNLADPAVMFFFLGVVIGLLRSNLEIPAPIAKFLSLYLLLALGFKGGNALREAGLSGEGLRAIGIALLLALITPALAFLILRNRINAFDAAAIAATYGSVSAVTFITATQFLSSRGDDAGGYMTAALVLMESPAIIMAVILATWARARASNEATVAATATASDSTDTGSTTSGSTTSGSTAADGPQSESASGNPVSVREVLHEAFTNGANLLLIGSMVIGATTGASGAEAMAPFVDGIFKGLLSFFLLEMGLLVARQWHSVRDVGPFLVGFGLVIPLVNAAIALGLGALLGVDTADLTLLAVLAASGSYIVVPAVVRYAIPEASPSRHLTLALGLTFPFNIIVGIPLYYYLAQLLTG